MWSESRWVASDSLQTPWTIQSMEFSRLEYQSGHSLLQAIFLPQGSNPGLLHCRRVLYHLSHKGSPKILEWVAYLFFSGYSWPRNWTRVSCIAGVFFTSWANRKAQTTIKLNLSQRCKSGSISANHSIWYIKLTKWKKKFMIANYVLKYFKKFNIHLWQKLFMSEYWRNTPQNVIKAIMASP